MRKFIPLIIAFIILSSFTIKHTAVVVPVNSETVNKPPENITISLEKAASMKMKEVEKIVGRKLTLREKIAIKFAQHKIKKSLKAKENGTSSKGQTAFILSLVGLCLLIVPYANFASLPLAIIGLVMGINAKKENPKDSKAQTAIVLSLVTLGLILLAVLLVVAIIASGGFWVY